MPRKVKFALEMTDGTFISNLEDLQKHIKNNDDVKKLIEYFLDGRLERWLLDRYYEKEAKAIKLVDKNDSDFARKLCKSIGVDYTPSGNAYLELIEYEKKMRKALEEVTSDSKIISNAGSTASIQSELDFLIKNGKKTIYLWGNFFKLPLVNDISYIGILGKPSVDIDLVDFNALKSYDIKFENVKLPESIKKPKNKQEDKQKKLNEKPKKKQKDRFEEQVRQLSEESRQLKGQIRQLEEALRIEEEARRQAEKKRVPTEGRMQHLKNAKVGDYVKFGSYPQNANGDIQPIEWQVLSKEKNKMFVISKYGLEAKRFDNSSNDWKNSEIRQWLNGDFYKKAFNENEKKLIRHSNISTNVYHKKIFWQYETAIVWTTDYLFLLSKEETEKYFANDDERRCEATEYAKANGACVNSSNGYIVWCLRSPNHKCSFQVYDIASLGNFNVNDVYSNFLVVRPAMWINI